MADKTKQEEPSFEELEKLLISNGVNSGDARNNILNYVANLKDSLINQQVLEAIAEIKTLIVPYARTDEVLNYIKQVENRYKGETIL